MQTFDKIIGMICMHMQRAHIAGNLYGVSGYVPHDNTIILLVDDHNTHGDTVIIQKIEMTATTNVMKLLVTRRHGTDFEPDELEVLTMTTSDFMAARVRMFKEESL